MTAVPTSSSDVAIAVRHSRIRWLGAPLLVTGALVLVSALLAFVAGGSGWNVMFGLFGTGTALATFGANHDTAMVHALRSREDPGLPASLAQELGAELQRDRAETLALRPSVGAGFVVPFLAIGAQSWVGWQLLGL